MGGSDFINDLDMSRICVTFPGASVDATQVSICSLSREPPLLLLPGGFVLGERASLTEQITLQCGTTVPPETSLEVVGQTRFEDGWWLQVPQPKKEGGNPPVTNTG